MGLKSKSLFAFKQSKECKHSFGCLEHFMRKVALNTGLYIVSKYCYEQLCTSEWTVKSVIDSLAATHLKLCVNTQPTSS